MDFDARVDTVYRGGSKIEQSRCRKAKEHVFVLEGIGVTYCRCLSIAYPQFRLNDCCRAEAPIGSRRPSVTQNGVTLPVYGNFPFSHGHFAGNYFDRGFRMSRQIDPHPQGRQRPVVKNAEQLDFAVNAVGIGRHIYVGQDRGIFCEIQYGQ